MTDAWAHYQKFLFTAPLNDRITHPKGRGGGKSGVGGAEKEETIQSKLTGRILSAALIMQNINKVGCMHFLACLPLWQRRCKKYRGTIKK